MVLGPNHRTKAELKAKVTILLSLLHTELTTLSESSVPAKARLHTLDINQFGHMRKNETLCEEVVGLGGEYTQLASSLVECLGQPVLLECGMCEHTHTERQQVKTKAIALATHFIEHFISWPYLFCFSLSSVCVSGRSFYSLLKQMSVNGLFVCKQDIAHTHRESRQIN